MRISGMKPIPTIADIETMLRNHGVANRKNIIFSVAATILFVDNDEVLEDIIYSVSLSTQDSNYICDLIFRLVEKEDKFIRNSVDQLLHNLSTNLNYEDLIKTFDVMLSEKKATLLSIIQGQILLSKDDSVNALSYEFFTDISWLNSLVIELMKLYGGNTLLSADCGSGIFMIDAYNESFVKYIAGYTRFKNSEFVASIRNYINGRNAISVSVKDTFYPKSDEKFDLIYASFPLMMKYEYEDIQSMLNEWRDSTNIKYGRKYSSNMLCTRNMIEQLTHDGTLISLVPDGCLYNGIDSDIRKYIIDNNYLDAIISLPSGIIPSTGVKTSLLIIRKNKKTDKVKFIDASQEYTKARRYNYFLEEHINKIVGLYNSNSEVDNVYIVSNNQIAEKEYNFGIDKYSIALEELINPCMLMSVCKSIFRGYQIKASELDDIAENDTEQTEYRILNVADVQAEGFISEDLQAVNISDTKKFEKYCLEDGDIIITAKNTTIKTAVYRQLTDEKVILSGNLLAIRVNKKKIDPFYLKTFLDSKSGQVAIASVQTGTAIKTINPNALKQMTISVLPMEQQTILSNSFKENVEKIISLQKEYSETAKKISGLFDEMQKR